MMKGFELSTNTIVILVILILVLVVLGTFIIMQSSKEMTQAQANNIFSVRCETYKDQGCTWDVTNSPGFDEFLAACKFLYGQDREAFSCLYGLCCEEASGTTCEGICSICKGNAAIGIATDQCVQSFDNLCQGTCNV